MFLDDTPTTDGAHPDRRTADRGTTRRSVLQTGLTAGVAATAFGGLTVTPAGAQSDDGPEAPSDLRAAWDWGGQRGVTWDWSGDRCDTDLSHFEITLESEDVTEEYEVPSQQRAVTVEPLGAETTVSVRAIGTDGQRSAPAQETFLASAVDPRYEISPASAPTVSAGRTTTVPVELRRVGGRHEDLVGYDLELSVGAPCVARIEGVTLPEASAMEVVDFEVAPNGSSAWLTVEGAPPETIDSLPLAHVELFGVEAGGTVLEVVDNSLQFLADDRDYSEYQAYQEDPSAFPDDVDYSDFRVEDDAIDRWKAVSVDGAAPPAPPENLRTGYWISTSVGITWDWPAGICSEELSEFEVTVYDAEHPSVAEVFEEQTVPAERPIASVDPAEAVQGNDDAYGALVEVRAVDEAGRHSEPVRESFSAAIADPGYTLHPTASPSVATGETATVPVEFGEVLAEAVGLVRYELDVEVRGPCVATVADVDAPQDDWEVLETDWAAEDGAVTVVAEGPPPADGDYHQQEIATIEVAGESPGETVLDVRDVELLALSRDFDYSQYEYARYAEDELDEEPEITVEEVTESVGASDTWSEVSVTLPTVVGDGTPRDVDGDGLYRDVNGDGSVTNTDVTTFFRNQHTSVIDDYPDAYDFTGDGVVGQADVIDLFESVNSGT